MTGRQLLKKVLVYFRADLFLRKIYELYADFALKNPFYSLEMPIRAGTVQCIIYQDFFSGYWVAVIKHGNEQVKYGLVGRILLKMLVDPVRQ